MTLVHWLVLPLVLHVLLTFTVGVLSLRARIAAVRGGKTRLKEIALDNRAWPDEARKYSNNFDNQFQVPLLAYAGVGLLVAAGFADGVCVVLMWLFIAARLLHTLEHVGRNRIRLRMSFFLISYAAVIALWLWFALRFFVIG